MALPLALFYVAIFLAYGAYVPYWPLWLERRGLDATGVGVLLGLGYIARVVGIPMVGAMVDRAGQYRRPLLILTCLAIASFGAFAIASSQPQLLVAGLLVSLTLQPVPPLTEGLAVSLAREGRIDYGRVRVWGSVAFIVASLAVGRLVALKSADAVLPWIVATLVLAALTSLRLPSPRVDPEATGRRWMQAIPELVRRPGVLGFLASVGTLQAGHALYYAVSAIDWRRQGLDPTAIGALWALGVGAEVVIIGGAGSVLRRIDPVRLALVGAAAGVVRWTLLACEPGLALLVVAQLLHAGSFAATHLATMERIRATVPTRLTATAQGVYSALAGGLLLGIATLLGGWLYARFAARAYFGMAALALIGGLGVYAGRVRSTPNPSA